MAITNIPIKDRIQGAWNSLFPKEVVVPKSVVKQLSPEAFYNSGTGTNTVVYAGSFNGEKNLGEIGPIKSYMMDYGALSLRAWQSYIESGETQTVISKYCTWVVGKGLKLQAEPKKELLSKTKEDLKEFSNVTEARWSVYAASKMSDYSGKDNLHKIANEAFKNAILSGDVLVVLRYINNTVKVQLIDGAQVVSPTFGTEYFPLEMPNGVQMVNGIEISKTGEHIAYHVRKPISATNPYYSLETERILARGKRSGILKAFMVYGRNHRLDNYRGIPIISAVLESLTKIERYKEAMIGNAEEIAKIVYQITHELGSTGEHPLTNQMAKAFDYDSINSDLPTDVTGKNLANDVLATTNKMAVNNPPGTEIKALKQEKGVLYFKEFYTTIVNSICSAIEMPPNVATSMYDSNYSASRAAIKDWEHTLSVKRGDFAFQFYQNVYNYWLEMQIHQNEISAPGYLTAWVKNDEMSIEAYRTARWVGAPVANIDPMKEVQSERLKLGITAESIPLTTIEAATEILNGGDSEHNMEQYSEELERSKALGLKPEPEVIQTSNVSDK